MAMIWVYISLKRRWREICVWWWVEYLAARKGSSWFITISIKYIVLQSIITTWVISLLLKPFMILYIILQVERQGLSQSYLQCWNWQLILYSTCSSPCIRDLYPCPDRPALLGLYVFSAREKGKGISTKVNRGGKDRLGIELMSVCRCNMRKQPKVKGDYVIDPEQFPAPPPEESGPQTTLLDLPQEHLDEVSGSEFSSDLCKRSHLSPRYIHYLCKTILYLHRHSSCADTDRSLEKFVAFSQALLNSQSSSSVVSFHVNLLSQVSLPTRMYTMSSRWRKCSICYLVMVLTVV